jgi:hypothetical protein
MFVEDFCVIKVSTEQSLNLMPTLRICRTCKSCSAEWHSAVSPIGNRQVVSTFESSRINERWAGCHPAIQQINNLRYFQQIGRTGVGSVTTGI